MSNKRTTVVKSKDKKVKKTVKSPVNTTADKSIRSFPIIGMGGSAGSFKAIEKFFMQMPADSGMAFVIVMHLDPHHHVDVAGLIQKFTTMPVMKVEDNL